jgi:hypothetical protein
MSLTGILLRTFSEQRAKNMSWDDLTRRLERSAEIVLPRFDTARNIPRHIEAAKHVIGIERWAQRRLRIALGEPATMDEYDSYRPESLNDIKALRDEFASTRRDTLTILRHLHDAGVSLDKTTPHNELGQLTIRGWVLYLTDHGWRETMMLRS